MLLLQRSLNRTFPCLLPAVRIRLHRQVPQSGPVASMGSNTLPLPPSCMPSPGNQQRPRGTPNNPVGTGSLVTLPTPMPMNANDSDSDDNDRSRSRDYGGNSSSNSKAKAQPTAKSCPLGLPLAQAKGHSPKHAVCQQFQQHRFIHLFYLSMNPTHLRCL